MFMEGLMRKGRFMLGLVGCLLTTAASANVMTCPVKALDGSMEFTTLNMNFETWHRDESEENGDLTKVKPGTFRWWQYGGEVMATVVIAKNGRSGTITVTGTHGEGRIDTNQCKFLTTGRTPGP